MLDEGSLKAPESDSPELQARQAELARLLAEILTAGVTERQARVIRARYFEQVQISVIAAELEISEAAVSRIHGRALAAIARALLARGIDAAHRVL